MSAIKRMHTDGDVDKGEEYSKVIETVKTQVLSFLNDANLDTDSLEAGDGLQTGSAPRMTNGCCSAEHLRAVLPLSLPSTGLGAEDLENITASILEHSVNTSSPAFLDKLWSSPSIPGIAADLLISSLNGNSHVFRVSPALTLIEKHMGIELASLFGLRSSHSGGITVPGGAAANNVALLIARNVRFPELKEVGIAGASRPLAVFVSESAHYSAMVSAQALGLGSQSVREVANTAAGSMCPTSLRRELDAAVAAGHTPLFVAATAGTTVRGAYDPLRSIGEIVNEYGAWFHVDACWGGAAIFSEKLKHKLEGSEIADSIAFNPHKMLGVPQICSFLLGKDLRTFLYANRLTAGYLFHEQPANPAEHSGNAFHVETKSNGANITPLHGKSNGVLSGSGITSTPHSNGPTSSIDSSWRSSPALLSVPIPKDVLDLASFTTQCGRRPDALKFYFHWRYYGKKGIAKHVETAFEGAQYLSQLILKEAKLELVGKNLLESVPCTQVCFYYRGASFAKLHPQTQSAEIEAKHNTYNTRLIAAGLMRRGWMVDYAPGSGKENERGEFLRVVCNRTTNRAVVEGLVRDILNVVSEDVEVM